MTNSWLRSTAGDLGRQIAAGQIDPVELTECYLEAIATNPMSDRIYARTTEVRARSEAEGARTRAKIGDRKGPLDGVPISWKDLFDTAGIVTEAGSALLEGRVPSADARVLSAASAQGTVCLGKTHMSELAYSGLGLNPVTATSPCVNDLDAVSGGSSSGAAASVAFGLAPAAIGSDTGGSVRVPAAWNDLVGLKTTHGALSLEGVVPLCLGYDTVGPLARSVEDAALVWDALGGGRAPDLRGATLSGVRFGVLNTVALDDVRSAPAKAFEESCKRFEAAGATLHDLHVDEVAQVMQLTGPLYGAESYGQWREEIEAAPEKMFGEILNRFRMGASVSGADYVQAIQARDRYRVAYSAASAGFDAILIPTSPILPPNAERLMSDSEYYVAENLLALRNTRIGNLLGLAALTLPTGTPSCGVSLMGGPGSEARLLRLGAACESALS